MSEVSIGPMNEGPPMPYAVDPVYRDGVVCDHCDEEIVGDVLVRGAAQNATSPGVVAEVLAANGWKYAHLCDDCHESLQEDGV